MLRMQTSRLSRENAAGFSLIELLMVMTLIALAASVVPAVLFKNQDQTRVTSVAREIVSSLRAARTDAMARQTPVRYTLDLEAQSHQVTGRESRQLPGAVQLAATVPAAFIEGSRASVVFFPDGSSVGGQIEVRSGTHRKDIDIRWLTGRVSLVDDVGIQSADP